MKRRARTRQRKPGGSASVSAAAPRVVILAAGLGSRMRSARPKVLHRVAGRTLLEAVLASADGLAPSRVVVVIGKGRESVAASLEGRDVAFAVQDPPLGTGDAARRGLEALGADSGGGPVVVLSGDTPLLRTETLRTLVELQRKDGLDLAFLSFVPPEPGAFGRVVRDARGRVQRIVELAVASPRERRIGEVNAGVYCFAPEALARALAGLRKNPVSREFYLTDAVEILARGKGQGRVAAITVEDWREAWGVNTRRDLAAAEEMEHRRGVERALDAGVTVLDPNTVRIGPSVVLAHDVVLHPYVSLEGTTVLEEGCEVLAFTRVLDSRIASGAVVGPHSDLEGARIGPRARVGPFSRIRPGSEIGEDARVGNFVETKNTILRRGVKALHLSYLGDAEIGAETNIGAGVITCNYDGENKHRTEIGERAFIGSDTQLVAPVRVGDGAYVGSGTTVTEDVPAGALALSRAPQTNKDGWVARKKGKKSG
jgi:bifunctional UDP-N-acetylglucosamine pyrophosphorylase/glucosamine-1-phosphate N-acetyltransferase